MCYSLFHSANIYIVAVGLDSARWWAPCRQGSYSLVGRINIVRMLCGTVETYPKGALMKETEHLT